MGGDLVTVGNREGPGSREPSSAAPGTLCMVALQRTPPRMFPALVPPGKAGRGGWRCGLTPVPGPPNVVPTVVAFLKEVESPYDVHDCIRSYLGDTVEAKEFAKQFLERRAKQRANQQRQQQQVWGGGPWTACPWPEWC